MFQGVFAWPRLLHFPLLLSQLSLLSPFVEQLFPFFIGGVWEESGGGLSH